MTPDSCFELARGTYGEMVPRRDHVRRRVRLPALQRRAAGRGRRGRHPDHAARRLLPRGRLRAGAERRPAPLLRRRRRRLGRARLRAERDADRADRRRDPLGPRGARRPDPHRRRVRGGPPAALPRLRAARRERGVPRRARLHARASCWHEHGALGPDSTAVHATHLTAGDTRLLARDHDLHVPDDRARPRRRHRRRRPADVARQRQPRGHRPVRGGPRGRARPAPGDRGPRPLPRGRPAPRAPRTTPASAGPPQAASSGARSPTS